MFQQAILHPQYGLKIIIFTNPASRNRYILLRPSEIDLELFLSKLNDECLSILKPLKTEDASFVQRVLHSMDSQWDRKCCSALLALNRSRSELKNISISPDRLEHNTNVIKAVLEEIDHAEIAATDMVTLRL